MDLTLTGEQEMLARSLRSLCEKEFPASAVRACEQDPGRAADFYRELFALGLGGMIASPEDGLTVTDVVVAHIELGRALVPLLFAESTVFAAGVLLASGGAPEVLDGIASGETRVTNAWLEQGAAESVRLSPDGKTISGRKILVPEVGLADHLIVLARTADGAPALALVDARASGVDCADQPNLADLALSRVAFANAPVRAVLARGAAAAAAFGKGLALMRVAVAAQAVGAAAFALDVARDYALTRQQFGRPIGSFQAIAHYLADAAVSVEGARMLAFRAAAALDAEEDPIDRTWADIAKYKACAVFRDVSALSIQIHGGIGFTLEADPQLYYRRAKHLQLMYGAPSELEEAVGGDLIAGRHKVLEHV